LKKRNNILLGILAFLAAVTGCGNGGRGSVELQVPRGYVQRLQIMSDLGLISFGPFVGYYFRPVDPSDLSYLEILCFNEKQFYTGGLPENAKLFKGEARLVYLPEAITDISYAERIHPLLFSDAPAEWVDSRPEPEDEFLHFHSCYNAAGPVLAGFWIRHVGVAEFTYDMGGRVTAESPLYHRVENGPDKRFARLIEFDRGPGQ
jgi:hypothetical protein